MGPNREEGGAGTYCKAAEAMGLNTFARNSVAREGMGAMHGTLEEVTGMKLKEENQPENIVDTWPGSEHHGSAGSKGILEEVMVGGLSPTHIFTSV